VDASRFDLLARAWAASRSRRGLARALSALGVAALAGSAGNGAEAATCAPRETRCGRRCVDTRKSERHCGRCRNACGTGQKCARGKCVDLPTCSDGIRNGDETGVDCGGPDCKACAGDPCAKPEDCAGGFCCGGVCADCAEDQVCLAGTTGTCCTPKLICKSGEIVDDCGTEVGEKCPPPPATQACLNPELDNRCCPDESCMCGCDECCPTGDACYVKANDEEFCCVASGNEICELDGACCSAQCDNGVCPDPLARIGSRRRTI
jgi:hypothetical protein